MDPNPNLEDEIIITGIMEDDNVFYSAEVMIVAGFPYIYNVEFLRNSDGVACNVTDELAHRIHEHIKYQVLYNRSESCFNDQEF